MPSRRSHSKSRNGCVQCKRARIKVRVHIHDSADAIINLTLQGDVQCDQSSPSCSKCIKSNKKCVYTLKPGDPSTTCLRPHLPSPTPTSPSSSAPLAAPSTPSFLISAFEPADLELMHHYSTSTYLTLVGRDSKAQEAWQVQVPIEAYSNPYLMHSLLALAALHRNSLTGFRESGGSQTSALRHYNDALATSKPALSNVNAANCTSLFFFSAVIAMITFALPLHSPGRQFDDPVANLMQISTLVRGSKSIVDAELDRIRAGPLAALLPDGFLAHEYDLPSDTRTALALLQHHVDACSDSDGAAKAAYNHTINLLELCFRNTVPDPENHIVVMSWLASVPDAYLSLLHARRPLAQVCIAYFAVLLHGLRRVWWCGDWGKSLVGWVEREGGGEWHGLLDWPKKKIGYGPALPV